LGRRTGATGPASPAGCLPCFPLPEESGFDHPHFAWGIGEICPEPDKITPVEDQNPDRKRIPILIVLIGLFMILVGLPGGLAGCASAMDPAQPTPTITPVINPPRGLEMYALSASPACRVGELSAIRVLDNQGDLLAWSPLDDTLAYIGSGDRSVWLVGPLMAASPPDFTNPLTLAAHAVGGLSWSPQGQRIAYLSLRGTDGLYTLNVVSRDGTGHQDLFAGEAAKTDEWSGAKRVTGWPSEDSLQLLASCGSSCSMPVEVDLLEGVRRNLSTPLTGRFDYWAITRNIPEEVPSDLAGLGQANWSADESRVAYIDTRSNLWVIDLSNETQFRLDTGRSPRLAEPKWSASGRYLAVRADTQLLVFDFECGRGP
jgi:hypothetical protein